MDISPTTHLRIEDVPEIVYPHASIPPLDISENLSYRQKVREICEGDIGAQEEYLRLCAEDSLFWLNTFAWLHEPRPTPRIIPFVIWPHQVSFWKNLDLFMGRKDLILEKSRGEGASWMAMWWLLHKWLFLPMFQAGVVSKDEDAVDNPSNLGTMLCKIDFALGNRKRNRPSTLPTWMIPEFDRNVTDHTFFNQENEASINGFSATANVATGDRKTVMIMDEFAKFNTGEDYHAMNSTQHVTNCRVFIGSPWGPAGAFFDVAHKDSEVIKCRLHWSDNPTRNYGMYKVLIDTMDRRSVEIIDHSFWKEMAQSNGYYCQSAGDVNMLAEQIVDDTNNNPFRYPFMLTGQFVKHGFPRSPWYDNECKRAGATPIGIAQELDIDYGGATSRFFDINMICRLQQDCETPVCYGELKLPEIVQSHHELEKCKFQILHGGRMAIWFHMGLMGTVPTGRNYVVACDVSAGTAGVASSNSTISVMDKMTGFEIASFAAPNILPERFAEYAVAVCYWFTGRNGNPAQLIWEANGSSGAQFGKRIADLGFPFVYYRGSTEETTERETSKMGFWTSTKTKAPLLGELGRALDRAECTTKNFYVLEEAKFYINLGGDRIEHIAATQEKDPSAAAARHGDRVIALALAWWIVKDFIFSGSSPGSTPIETPENCALARRLKTARENRQEHAWVPPSQRRNRLIRRRL